MKQHETSLAFFSKVKNSAHLKILLSFDLFKVQVFWFLMAFFFSSQFVHHAVDVSSWTWPRFVLLERVRASPGKYRRHAFHDALEPQRPLGGQLHVLDPVHQAVKHRQHAVVALCCRHLVEEAVRAESQQLALLGQHRPSVVQVPFVAYEHDGGFLCAVGAFGGPDVLDEPAGGVEAGPVADAVDQNEAIRPLDLLMEEGRLSGQILTTKNIILWFLFGVFWLKIFFPAIKQQ